jgi:hypothetical protein
MISRVDEHEPEDTRRWRDEAYDAMIRIVGDAGGWALTEECWVWITVPKPFDKAYVFERLAAVESAHALGGVVGVAELVGYAFAEDMRWEGDLTKLRLDRVDAISRIPRALLQGGEAYAQAKANAAYRESRIATASRQSLVALSDLLLEPKGRR